MIPDVNTRSIPQNAEWATAPLRDPSNVGKLVWHSWNSNRAEAAILSEVTRTGVRVAGSTKLFRAEAPDLAANRGRWCETLFTDALRLESEERNALILRIRKANLDTVSIVRLRDLADRISQL